MLIRKEKMLMRNGKKSQNDEEKQGKWRDKLANITICYGWMLKNNKTKRLK